MSNLLKELWYKWRARVYFDKAKVNGEQRLKLKETQLSNKRKAEEYVAKYKKVSKI